jgi:hypothetical protein
VRLSELNESLPDSLIQVIEKTMSVDKTKRYSTMEELRGELERELAEL